MAINILILIITALFIAWGLCRSKQTEKQAIRKTDVWFTVISLGISAFFTIVGTWFRLTDHIRILLLPAVAISLMCIYMGRRTKHESDKVFSKMEKAFQVLMVIFLCSGLVDCSYRYPRVRFTDFYMASMFYKMLGGWILAELVFCRHFPLAQVKAFFLTVLTVNVIRFILLFSSSIYQDGFNILVQIGLSFFILGYMYFKYPGAYKIKIDKKS